MTDIKVAFWNLQNLFDTTVSEIAADLEFTPAKGWTKDAFDQKVANLASVINMMHDGKGPDLLGICEIENKKVAQRLIDEIGRKDYELAHVEVPDIRGIDCSLIYSNKVFELLGEPVGYLVHLRYPTRDIFEVKLRVLGNNAELTVAVNHWPSRSRGQYESEPNRIATAERCGWIVDKTLKFPRDEFLILPDTQNTLAKLNKRWNSNVLIMGDLNDEPFNRSILNYLRASKGEDNIEEEIKRSRGKKIPTAKSYLRRKAYLFNCMWPPLGEPDTGTYYYSRSTNTMNFLDQFIISRGMLYGRRNLRMDLNSVEIFTPSIIKTRGKGRPRPFKFTKTGFTKNGYSDHYPILSVIRTV